MTATMEFRSDVDELDRVIAFVDGALEGTGAPRRSVLQLELAVEEIFVNIASYAYRGDDGKVRVSCDVDGDAGTVTVTFRDSGPEFDPLAAPDPDTTLPAEDRRIGGLGIFLVKTNVDGMDYERRDGCNVLTIRKSLARRTRR